MAALRSTPCALTRCDLVSNAMKCLNKCVALVVVTAIAVTACAGGSSSTAPVADPTVEVLSTQVPTDTAIAEVAEEPTATVVPVELTEQDKIDAALASFEAQPEPAELVAWDHLDAQVVGDQVTLRMCTWTGDTVFDDLRVANYIVKPGPDGVADVRLNFANTINGDCLNTELIDSALAFTREYDTFWGSVLEDPATFDPEQAENFKTSELITENVAALAEWIRDDLYFREHDLDGMLPETAVDAILVRGFALEAENYFDLLACRDIDENYGLYQGDVLIDDQKGEFVYDHIIQKYQLVRRPDGWLMAGTVTYPWSDCLRPGESWIERVNTWQPDPVPWIDSGR